MNNTEKGICKYLGLEKLSYLQTKTIGIAGAGGLGSNCAVNLVRCGFKNFIITDFDKLESSNLNRQAYNMDQLGTDKVIGLKENLLKINPDLNLKVHNIKVDQDNMHSLFSDCEAIIEAFDVPQTKKLLVESFISSPKLIVAASGIAGFGSTDKVITRKVRENFYVVGDFETESSELNPPYSPKVTIVAAKQADVVFTHFMNQFELTKVK